MAKARRRRAHLLESEAKEKIAKRRGEEMRGEGDARHCPTARIHTFVARISGATGDGADRASSIMSYVIISDFANFGRVGHLDPLASFKSVCLQNT